MLALVTLTLSVLPVAGDWYVDASHTQCEAATGSSAKPFCTIGEAFALASSGDTIHVAPGTYAESLAIDRAVTLIGTGGSAQTVLDGLGTSWLIRLAGGVDFALRGFTLQNAFDYRVGPAISVFGSLPASVSVADCTFQDNLSFASIASGGAIYAGAGDWTITDSIFRRNEARSSGIGGFADAFGGAIYARGTSLTLVRTKVEDNDVTAFCFSDGAGVYSYGPALTIVDCEFTGNGPGAGAGVSNYAGALASHASLPGTIVRSRFRGNSGSIAGGISASSALSFEDVELSDNFGGALRLTSASFVFRRCTIVGDQPPALMSLTFGATMQMESCIVWGAANGQNLIQGDAASLAASVVDYSNIGRGWSGAGTGNLSTFPSFVDRPGGDFHLRTTSPCVDAGDPTFASNELDIEGNVRVLDGDLDRAMRVDMGAYELSHARLDVTGEASAGGTLTASITGTAGLPVFLAIGMPRDDGLVLPPWGTLFFELGPGATILGLGALPASIDFPVPASLPGPVTATFQALAFGPALASGALPGTVSNPITLTITP